MKSLIFSKEPNDIRPLGKGRQLQLLEKDKELWSEDYQSPNKENPHYTKSLDNIEEEQRKLLKGKIKLGEDG